MLRRPGLVELGAVDDDDAAVRVGDEGELVVRVAGVERDVVEETGRPGHDALGERVDARHPLGADVEEDQLGRTGAAAGARALAAALLVSHVYIVERISKSFGTDSN